jgi:signal transduction histidine kinase
VNVLTKHLRRLTLRRRVVMGTAVATSLGMIALTVLVQVVLALFVDKDIGGALADRTDAVRSTLVDDSGALHARETPTAVLDEYAWIYDDQGRLVEGSTIAAPLSRELVSLRSVTAPTTLDTGDYRLLATPVQLTASGPTGVVVAAEPLAPYEHTERNALLVSILLGILVVAGVTALVAWAVHHALHPVAAMSARADEWSEHDLSRRFDLGPGGDEISALGRTLDTLLERVSRVIRGEQRLSSELAHELRTPLTAIRGEAELALSRGVDDPASRESLERVVRSSEDMADIISTLMTMSRKPTGFEESSRLDDAVTAAVASVPEHGARSTLSVELPFDADQVSVAVPESAVARIVAPILDNAMRYKHTSVRVSADHDAHDIRIIVEDDGPGLGVVSDDDVFCAGARHPDSPGAGLGLSLSRRLAEAVGGTVRHVDPAVGTRFVITLPRE